MRLLLRVGENYRAFESDVIPPVGTSILVHKHLTDDGEYAQVQVIRHDWRLEQVITEDGEHGLDELEVMIETIIVPSDS